jgi:hypothetical protein
LSDFENSMRDVLVLKTVRNLVALVALVVFVAPFGWPPSAWSTANEPILSNYSIASITDADRARAALSATAEARGSYLEQWQAQHNECRQRIAVTRCQSQLKAERQAYESKIGAIDVHARQVIRNAALTERNAAEARNSVQPAGQGAAQGAAQGPSDKAGSPATLNADPQSQRVAQQQARISQHEAALDRQKQAGIAESKRRQERVSDLERRRTEQIRKIAEGRKKAARKNES